MKFAARFPLAFACEWGCLADFVISNIKYCGGKGTFGRIFRLVL
jgi:hypothetical protein